MNIKELLKSGKLSFYICIVCIMLMSLQIHWLPPFMILFPVVWFFERKGDLNWNNIKSQPSTYLLMLFFALFLWQVTGLLYSDSPGPGLERVVKRAAFVLFPAALFFPGEIIQNRIKLILKLYSVFIFIYVIYSLGNSLFNSFHFEGGKWIFRAYNELYTYESYFTGPRLSGSVHPTYLAMYVNLALIIAIDSIFDLSPGLKRRFFWSLIAVVFLVTILLLSSRSGILSTAVTLPIFLFVRFIGKIPSWVMISILSLFAIIFTVSLLVNTRFRDTVDDISGRNFDKTLNQDTRLLIWKSAAAVIKKNPLFGTGTGDASAELKKEYASHNYPEGYYSDMNAHNQFLEILLENGIIGLLLFIVIIGYMIHISLEDKNYMLQVFTISIIIFFVFESMLNRLSGIMFFPLVTFLLLHLKEESIDAI